MSVVAIPFGEILAPHSSTESIKKAPTLATYKFQGKKFPVRNASANETEREKWTKNRDENIATKFLSPTSCDPLLNFVNLADFENDEKLERNFEEVLKIRKMGFPVKIIKQKWFPGLICIPIFHCRRCLALWTQAAQVPTLCSEVNRSVYGHLIPISITKCDLLTKLLNHDRKPTMQRLCKQLPLRNPIEVEEGMNVKERLQAASRIFKPIPVAEFIDINEQLRKYRRKFLQELKRQRSDVSGNLLDPGGRNSTPVDECGSDDDGGGLEEVDSKRGTGTREVFDEERKAADEELKPKPWTDNHKAHERSCYSSRYKANDHCKVCKSTLKSPRGHRLENKLMITSQSKATKHSTPTSSTPAAETKLKTKRRKITKITRPPTTPCRPSSTCSSEHRPGSYDVPVGVAYENKLAELRQKTRQLDKDVLKELFGDRFETLDPSFVNSVWFNTLIDEQAATLRKWKMTRAFCFSYFQLLRKT